MTEESKGDEVTEAVREISLVEDVDRARAARARRMFLRAKHRILREQNANETIPIKPVAVETVTSGSSESKQINLVLASTRMNPPTPGHMRLLEKLIMEGIEKETNEVYVVLSKKNDDIFNPINCEDKIYYLNGFDRTRPDHTISDQTISDQTISDQTIPDQTIPDQTIPDQTIPDQTRPGFNEDEQQNQESFVGCVYGSMVCALKRKMIEKINNMKVIFECVEHQPTPFHKVRDIIQNKLSMLRTLEGQKLKVYLVVGDDRRGTLGSMENMIINEENANHISFEEIVIPREDIGDLKSKSLEDISRMNINEISPNQISGSLVRKLATDNPEKFLEIYSNYISDDKKLSLLGNINEGMSRISEEMKMREEDKASRRAMLAEDKASRRAMPAEDKASRRAMPAEDKASRRAMPAEAKASGRAMPAEDNKASRRARGLPGRGSVADRQTEIQGGRRIRQNIIRKTSSDQKRTTRKKKGGVSKKLRRRKTVKNKRKFRKNNNKTKNNKMKNRRQTRKHK
jgi:hypothetical protein